MKFFSSFTFRLLFRLFIINLLVALFVYLIQNTELWFTIFGVGVILLAALFSLYHYIDRMKEDINRFMLAVKTQDSTINFKSKSHKSSFPELYRSFDDIIQVHKRIQLEKESMFQLIKTILEQVPVGVIVLKPLEKDVEKAEIVFFNMAASNLLQVPAYKYWHRLKSHRPEFANQISDITEGGKKFIELKIQDKLTQLSTELIPLNLHNTDHIIISFQNIKDEIEQKESEAWNRLIGVISHEILNSITPISSLSDTVSSMVDGKDHLDKEDLEDLKPALLTIKRRSEGLLDFVKDYRLMAELPTPVLQDHTIGEILQHIKILMQPFASGKNIDLRVVQTSSKISLRLDIKLIEQALINLVTNSIYAVENMEDPFIEIGYRLENSRLYIDVIDNGKGVDNELAKKVFIPFFTTRKNGSGIGLTITRNIMKMHHGSVEIQSQPFEKTVFSLVFKYQ
ncbi:sensor histidine kinase [Pedobacter sp. SAFR-022]|uniref:sensor histidine kinase n=1 Tax=Pedobacter sp. SAFR-022 TaxID=3436861 RepID=UPI003F7F623E